MTSRWVELANKQEVIDHWDVAVVRHVDFAATESSIDCRAVDRVALDKAYPYWYDTDTKNGWMYCILVED